MSFETTLRLATIDVDDGRGNVLQGCVVETTTVDNDIETPIASQHALNLCLGNREGRFDTKGWNFTASARHLELSSGLLSAELRTSQGEWKKASIALRAQTACSEGSWTH